MDGQDTFFAPAGRVAGEELEAQLQLAASDPVIRTILAALNGYILILNAQRQILAVSEELAGGLRLTDPLCFASLRPGELFGCVHSQEGPDGCGTGPACRECGAVICILAAQEKNDAADGECRLTMKKDGSMAAAEFKLRVSPVRMGDEQVLVMVLQDVSAIRRREILEQVFFHDLLDAVGGLAGWSSLLNSPSMERSAAEVVALTNYLHDEVVFHKTLAQAEQRQLEVVPAACTLAEIVAALQAVFRMHAVARYKALDVQVPDSPVVLYTDRMLLVRVLTNMVKNAFEATPPEGRARLAFEMRGRVPVFRVHNDAFIPPEQQKHIFERMFSTRGSGRGIGTYSIKLFGEQYLHGKVGFTTDPQAGTDFTIELPAQPVQGMAPAPAGQAGAAAETGGLAVLVVEDDDSMMELTRLLLQKLNITVQAVAQPGEALELLDVAPRAFDLLMVDYNLTEMDGLELAQRAMQLNPDLPVLICTGMDTLELRQAARACGVRRVSQKPVSVNEMRDLLVSAGVLAG